MIVVTSSCHSGPMRAYVLAREDAIRHWRELMGPTKVFRARHTSPASIRAQFGLTDTRNTTHGSGRNSLCILRCSQINSVSTQTTFCHRMILAEYSFSSEQKVINHSVKWPNSLTNKITILHKTQQPEGGQGYIYLGTQTCDSLRKWMDGWVIQNKVWLLGLLIPWKNGAWFIKCRCDYFGRNYFSEDVVGWQKIYKLPLPQYSISTV